MRNNLPTLPALCNPHTRACACRAPCLPQAGSRRPDLRIYDAVVEALLENSGRISQLVVVTPLGGGGGGFFGGGGAKGGQRLSSVERAVVDSGLDYLIVRAAPSDRVTDRYGEQAGTVVAPAGGLPSSLQVSRSQVRWEGGGRAGGPRSRPRAGVLPMSSSPHLLVIHSCPAPPPVGGRRGGRGHGAGAWRRHH